MLTFDIYLFSASYMSWGKFALVELWMHVEPFVGGSNPPKWQKKAQFCMYILIKTINLISVLIIKLYKIH